MNVEAKEEDILPSHPGEILKGWFMSGKNISEKDLSAKTGIALDDIKSVIIGNLDIDSDIAKKLSIVFGKSAETLYRMQAEYNYFKMSNKIAKFEDLPRLDR